MILLFLIYEMRLPLFCVFIFVNMLHSHIIKKNKRHY